MIVVLDDIIFSRQLNGGISVYWREITRSIRTNIDLKAEIFASKKQGILCDVSYKLEQPHVFHSSYFRTTSNKKAVNILTVHDCIHMKRKNLRNIIFHFFLKNKLKKSDLVICVSETTRNDLFKYYKKSLPKRIEVIYNGVDSNFKDLKLKREKKILFVGARSWYKNFIYSIKISKFLNYSLIIVGKPLNKKEKKIVEDFNISYSILTNISTKKLVSLYNTVSFLVYCSKYEGFGIPLIEAARCKCPVVTLDRPFVREILGDNTIKVKDESLKVLIDYINNKKLLKKITRNAYKKSLNYCWNKSAEKLKSLYLSAKKNN